MGPEPESSAAASGAGRLITVGIPVFNGKSLLRSCLQSVIGSTLPHERYEIVVADDHSTESETLEILSEFEQNLAVEPGFFRVITSPTNSGGAARPRNRIIDAATGDYIFFIDSDDTIGSLALERIARVLEQTPADWVALNQVAVNGRLAVCTVKETLADVPRSRALTTLTVHKLFRRAEIERQQLRFDERLLSGQDLAFAFSFIVNASSFLMLGGYDYYHLTQHLGNPNEPVHLSLRANYPEALIAKYEQILRTMLEALHHSDLSEPERRQIVAKIVLPRMLIHQGYLKSIVNAGEENGTPALRQLAELLTDPMVAELDRADLKGVTAEQLQIIARADWNGLARSVNPDGEPGVVDRLTDRWRIFFDVVSGRKRHRRVVTEIELLRRTVEDLRNEQRRLDARLEDEFDELRRSGSSHSN